MGKEDKVNLDQWTEQEVLELAKKCVLNLPCAELDELEKYIQEMAGA